MEYHSNTNTTVFINTAVKNIGHFFNHPTITAGLMLVVKAITTTTI